ncbi:MAG: hypothetical protein JST31_06890 [Actinobacteria bacterium]|nr:hypothetical protein [Actinomycetota bacterium]
MRTLRMTIGAAAVAALLATGTTAAGAAAPSFYRNAARLEGALRDAVEREPEALLKSLSASERICELGEGAAARGETALAEADWSALDQAITVLDEPQLAAVRRALAAARAELSAFAGTYRRAWRGQGLLVRRLTGATAQVRHGAEAVAASLAVLDTAFPAWHEHRCEAALAATAAANQGAAAGVARIAAGMERVWALGRAASPARRAAT